MLDFSLLVGASSRLGLQACNSWVLLFGCNTSSSSSGNLPCALGPAHAFHLEGLNLGGEPRRCVPRLPIRSLGTLNRP